MAKILARKRSRQQLEDERLTLKPMIDADQAPAKAAKRKHHEANQQAQLADMVTDFRQRLGERQRTRCDRQRDVAMCT